MLSAVEQEVYLDLSRAGPRPARSIQPLPSPWESGEVVYKKPPASDDTIATFDALLEKRRSAEDLSTPIQLSDLLSMLSLVLTRPTQKPSARRYPTAGNCDELGILIIARRIEGGLPEGAYWANAKGGRLQSAAMLGAGYLEYERRNALFLSYSDPPSATLLILANWSKIAARYERCVLASALCDCGTLLQTLSLAATATGINACISACIQPELIGEWLKLDWKIFGHVGTLSLGGSSGETLETCFDGPDQVHLPM